MARKPEVPGIDDCDHLYTLTSRDGKTSAYLRVHEINSLPHLFVFGLYHCALTWDDDVSHSVDDLPCNEGPFETPEAALLANIDVMRTAFRDQGLGFVYCDDTRKIVLKAKTADRRARRLARVNAGYPSGN